MVALALGIALVLWFFIQTIRHPSKQQSGGKAAALQTYRQLRERLAERDARRVRAGRPLSRFDSIFAPPDEM